MQKESEVHESASPFRSFENGVDDIDSLGPVLRTARYTESPVVRFTHCLELSLTI